MHRSSWFGPKICNNECTLRCPLRRVIEQQLSFSAPHRIGKQRAVQQAQFIKYIKELTLRQKAEGLNVSSVLKGQLVNIARVWRYLLQSAVVILGLIICNYFWTVVKLLVLQLTEVCPYRNLWSKGEQSTAGRGAQLKRVLQLKPWETAY